MNTPLIERAAQAILQADAILIGAGAGMGVDSGLPDFRGNEGFWQAYPKFKHLGLSFIDLANPRWFKDNPAQAWGFYGHRYNLYRQTQAHQGFQILLNWIKNKPFGGFVFTSNVDGHFQQAGFQDAQVLECHGSIHHLQCRIPCHHKIWPNTATHIQLDEKELLAEPPYPSCPKCQGIARPNILMFGDGNWLSERTDQQAQQFHNWLSQPIQNLVVIELGAGTAVPTVRYTCEQVGGQLIRINPRESHGPNGCISIDMGGLDALRVIDQYLKTSK